MRAALEHAGMPSVTTQILEGEPGAAIVREAAASCDGVVRSPHGRSGPRRALLGSVADHVVRHSTLPVLLCRSPRMEVRFSRVLLADDGSPLAAVAVP